MTEILEKELVKKIVEFGKSLNMPLIEAQDDVIKLTIMYLENNGFLKYIDIEEKQSEDK